MGAFKGEFTYPCLVWHWFFGHILKLKLRISFSWTLKDLNQGFLFQFFYYKIMVNFSIILEILVKFTPFYITKIHYFLIFFCPKKKIFFFPPSKKPLVLTLNPLNKYLSKNKNWWLNMKRSKNKTKIRLKQGKDKMWWNNEIVRMKLMFIAWLKKNTHKKEG